MYFQGSLIKQIDLTKSHSLRNKILDTPYIHHKESSIVKVKNFQSDFFIIWLIFSVNLAEF